MAKITVIWDDDKGVPVADKYSDVYIKEYVESKVDQIVYICNEAVLNSFRIASIKGFITDIEIYFYDTKLDFNNSTGRFSHWPKGFADTCINQLDEII